MLQSASSVCNSHRRGNSHSVPVITAVVGSSCWFIGRSWKQRYLRNKWVWAVCVRYDLLHLGFYSCSLIFCLVHIWRSDLQSFAPTLFGCTLITCCHIIMFQMLGMRLVVCFYDRNWEFLSLNDLVLNFSRHCSDSESDLSFPLGQNSTVCVCMCMCVTYL